jgi:hypothetical protein
MSDKTPTWAREMVRYFLGESRGVRHLDALLAALRRDTIEECERAADLWCDTNNCRGSLEVRSLSDKPPEAR